VRVSTPTPARLIEKLRVEHARTLLLGADLPLKALAAKSGFGSAARMNRAFARALGMGPREYRLLHAAGGATTAAGKSSAPRLSPSALRGRGRAR
jgi:AraC-like DNA-binding protein